MSTTHLSFKHLSCLRFTVLKTCFTFCWWAVSAVKTGHVLRSLLMRQSDEATTKKQRNPWDLHSIGLASSTFSFICNPFYFFLLVSPFSSIFSFVTHSFPFSCWQSRLIADTSLSHRDVQSDRKTHLKTDSPALINKDLSPLSALVAWVFFF